MNRTFVSREGSIGLKIRWIRANSGFTFSFSFVRWTKSLGTLPTSILTSPSLLSILQLATLLYLRLSLVLWQRLRWKNFGWAQTFRSFRFFFEIFCREHSGKKQLLALWHLGSKASRRIRRLDESIMTLVPWDNCPKQTNFLQHITCL